MAVISFEIDDKTYRRFRAELIANDEEMGVVMNDMVRRYVEQSLCGELADRSGNNHFLFKADGNTRKEKVSIEGKAKRKIPVWVVRKNVPYRIIRAFLILQENRATPISVDDLEELCTSGRDQSVYVKNFKANFAQMKFDDEKSHGKVFLVNGDEVRLDEDILSTVDQYKPQFLKNE